MKRLAGLDVIRGIGILAVVYLHSATFHYQGITEIDWNDPPPLIQVIGFLLMWAGLFAIVSSAAYAYSAALRIESGRMHARMILKSFWVAGGLLLVLHYIYFIFLAPKLLDVAGGNHQHALLPGWIASPAPLLSGKRFPPIYPERVFYSTTLSMIAWNLLLTGPLLRALSGRGGLARMRRNGAILGGLGTAVMLLSLARIPLYPWAVHAIEQRNVLAAVVLGFLVGKNNPILPYLGFGLFGTWLGLALVYSQSTRRALCPFVLIGVLWLVAGLVGLFALPTTMLEREVDLYWYFIMVFQLGFFLLLVAVVLGLIDFWVNRPPVLLRALKPIRRLGMVSLTIFMLETVLSQILVRFADVLFPGWSLDIGPCLIFGALNTALWIGIIVLWARFDYRYSMEWLTVRVYALFRRPSNKVKAQDLLSQSD
jgi:hypothetical protein